MTTQLALPTLGTLYPLLSLRYIVHWPGGDEHPEFETMDQAKEYREDHRDGWDMTIETVEDDEQPDRDD